MAKKSRVPAWLVLLRDRMMLFFPLFLLALVALNSFVAYRAFRLHDVERQSFARSVVEFRSEVAYLKTSYESHITNLLNSVRLLKVSTPDHEPTNVASSVSLVSPVPTSVPVSFHFYSLGGRPSFRYFGSDYSVGSETSFGRVVKVFPDRVFFDSGCVLVNNRNPDDAIFNRAVLSSTSTESVTTND